MKPKVFIDQLKNACSDIGKEWSEHLELWEGDEPGFYNEINVIVRYVITRFKQNNLTDFEEIAKIVNSGLISENETTSELALIGFLEGILFVGSHDNISPVNHKDWLHEESYLELVALEKVFNGLHNKSLKSDAASGAA